MIQEGHNELAKVGGDFFNRVCSDFRKRYQSEPSPEDKRFFGTLARIFVAAKRVYRSNEASEGSGRH